MVVLFQAYKNFGNRIKTLKRKLEEFLPRCPSPVPSPDVDAPSPSSGSDIDIPDENKSGGERLRLEKSMNIELAF